MAALLLECAELNSNIKEKQEYLQEAKSNYEEDLRHYPRNIWSLVGLKRCEILLGNVEAFSMEDDLRSKFKLRYKNFVFCLCAGLLENEVNASTNNDTDGCCSKRNRRQLKSKLLPIPPTSNKRPRLLTPGQDSDAPKVLPT